jgi:hypothetical protein
VGCNHQRWRRCVPLKHRTFLKLHGIITQTAILLSLIISLCVWSCNEPQESEEAVHCVLTFSISKFRFLMEIRFLCYFTMPLILRYVVSNSDDTLLSLSWEFLNDVLLLKCFFIVPFILLILLILFFKSQFKKLDIFARYCNILTFSHCWLKAVSVAWECVSGTEIAMT